MRSVDRSSYGPPESLRVSDLPMPSPGPGEILVRVHVATVNRTDCGGLRGEPYIFRFFAGFPKPRHRATGTDFAGVVEKIGANVGNYAVGDRVWGFNDHGAGTHAEYAVIPVHSSNGAVAKIPEGLSFEDAVGSIEGAHYAINFINKVKLRPGDKVLVNGGTGAIGSAAIQILKARDIQVTAVCAGPHVERVAKLGPDRVIDYTKFDYTQEALQYDFVFDAVGKNTFGTSRRVLTPHGIYISSELGPGAENIYLALITPWREGQKVVFPIPTNIAGSLQVMTELLVAGKFRPLIDREYPIERISEAFRYVESGQKIGNVILRMSTSS